MYHHLELFDKSVEDCDRAIELNPKMVKAYYRKAQSLAEKLQIEPAIAIIKQALEIDPEN